MMISKHLKSIFKFSNPKQNSSIAKIDQEKFELMKKEKEQKMYDELESTKYDSIFTIRQRYINKKVKLGDRRVYHPAKKQLMERLDKCMQQIEEIHDESYAMSEYGGLDSKNIQQRITLELKLSKQKYWKDLLMENRTLCAMNLVLIGILISIDVLYITP